MVRPRTAKRQRRMTYGQVGGGGGISPDVLRSIGKASYGITKVLGDHQRKQATKISLRGMREVEQGKRKKYAGESFNCSIM